jgi:hypothetical protein
MSWVVGAYRGAAVRGELQCTVLQLDAWRASGWCEPDRRLHSESS